MGVPEHCYICGLVKLDDGTAVDSDTYSRMLSDKTSPYYNRFPTSKLDSELCAFEFACRYGGDIEGFMFIFQKYLESQRVDKDELHKEMS